MDYTGFDTRKTLGRHYGDVTTHWATRALWENIGNEVKFRVFFFLLPLMNLLTSKHKKNSFWPNNNKMFVTIEIIYNQRQNCWHVALFNPLVLQFYLVCTCQVNLLAPFLPKQRWNVIPWTFSYIRVTLNGEGSCQWLRVRKRHECYYTHK